MAKPEVLHPIKLYVYNMKQDDPRKCTSRKLVRLNLASSINRSRFPRKAIVLNPLTPKVLLSKDRKIVEANGLLAIDCSWKKVQDTWPLYFHGTDRRLPLFVVANPIHYGHLYELSSIEAFASALYIIKHETQARRILSIYKWGPVFLSLNQELLNEYQCAKTEEEVIEIEESTFNIHK